MVYYYNKTTYRLLDVLINNPLIKFKESELIKKAKTGKGSANVIINELVKGHIINEERIGKAKLISLNIHYKITFLLKNIFDQEKLSQINPRVRAAVFLLKQRIQHNNDLIVLFGSQVAGTATEKSDIDLLVVGDDLSYIHQERTKIEELFSIKFNLHEYDLKEIENNLKTDFFIQRALFSGIAIHGFDTLHNLFLEYQKSSDFERILFFIERINAARRNYLQKDEETSKEIIKIIFQQMTYFVLSEKNINYISKKDALQMIKKTSEGKKLEQIKKLPHHKIIEELEDFNLKLLTQKILLREGYG